MSVTSTGSAPDGGYRAGRPLRVLMTTDAMGGAWMFALELCRSLGALGVEVVLATMGREPSAGQRAQLGALEHVTLFTSSYRLEWMIDPWHDVDAAGRWLVELADDLRVDVAHLNGYAHAVHPWRVPVLLSAHSCVVQWWDAVRGREPPPHWREYRERVRAGLAAADSVVAPTMAALSGVQRHYGALYDARVIYAGRERAGFRPEPKRAVVLTSGALWDDAKNVAALDAVALELPWPVMMAGPVMRSDGTRSAPVHMRPLGPIGTAALASELGGAAIFALPARYEPFAFSLLEAALSGCALVLGDIPSLRELWADAAVFVPPDDRAALRDALLRLINDAPLRQHLARQAWRAAVAHDPAHTAAAYLALYRELIARRPAHAA